MVGLAGSRLPTRGPESPPAAVVPGIEGFARLVVVMGGWPLPRIGSSNSGLLLGYENVVFQLLAMFTEVVDPLRTWVEEEKMSTLPLPS